MHNKQYSHRLFRFPASIKLYRNKIANHTLSKHYTAIV